MTQNLWHFQVNGRAAKVMDPLIYKFILIEFPDSFDQI